MNCPKCKQSLTSDSVHFIGAIQCDVRFVESFVKCRNCDTVSQIAMSGETIVDSYEDK